MHTFDSLPLSEEQRKKVAAVREGYKTLLALLNETCPQGRELSLAITELEYSSMRAVKAISHAPVAQ